VADDITGKPLQEQATKEIIERFCFSLALATTNWQGVEVALREIARIAIHPQLPGAFHAGYHGLQNTSLQFRFTEAAIAFWLEANGEQADALQDEWRKLCKKVNDQIRTRNALTHFSIYSDVEPKRLHEKIYLAPMLGDTRYATGKSSPRYRVSEIDDAGRRFLALAQELMMFFHKMIRVEAAIRRQEST
jgi:hypothetical protein